MKSPVNIKGTKSGMIIALDDSLDFEELKIAVKEKFESSASFFGEASIAIAFEGRKLSDLEKFELADIISVNSELNIVCISEDDPDKAERLEKSLNDKLMEIDTRTGQFYKGNLRNGQVIDFETSVIILGDVNAGAQVVSKGSIIVLGSLHGNAFAGAGGSNNSFVAALELKANQIRICDTIARAPDNPDKQDRKSEPQIAFCENGNIYIEPISRESLSDIHLD